ncbi:hypothetical protein CC1G_10058 [Coprinopsis cinerea okayama7|uniref:Uncharacterized protein n=1 Tax=Coprinopsis cinerea (strain Okayama-7 / 130 / ATCC MYA-4618 / FGSC 9003) TaxID=240176 RepID=A8NUY6_COPC7|nr:hypothetical protein CC1G_10058 [Coprinopsis cinerea okayama7\|eukprot:XP_001836564.2 hypothetical protein CC1G_10058 [Coprinopsis cinerea okayama7\
MGALKRTESCLSLLDLVESNQQPSRPPPTPTKDAAAIPYTRSLQYQADQRAARRKLNTSKQAGDSSIAFPAPPAVPPRRIPSQQSQSPAPRPSSNTRSSRSRNINTVVISNASSSTRRNVPPSKVILPSAKNLHAVAVYSTQRTSSPLAPVQTVLPDRPIFPRSRTEPDLYKKALIGRMKTTDQGRRVLRMGPRLAISVWMATQDLEKMVQDTIQRERDLDIIMGDSQDAPEPTPCPVPARNESQPAPPVLTNSWVVVKPSEDWEMVDCSA